MRKPFFKNKRALSPVISTIILIAVTVTVSLGVTSWMGSLATDFMSVEEFKVTDCQWAQDLSYADLMIRNYGTAWIVLTEVNVNGASPTYTTILSDSSKVDAGDTAVVRVFDDYSPSTRYRFEVLTARRTMAACIKLTDSLPVHSLHYVNAISNVDGSSDKGTHSNFANQQSGPDSIFDVLTEGDYGAGLTSIIQYANSSSSDVDFSGDVGIETSFGNSQDYSPDSDFMTIQEENLGGGGGAYPNVRSKAHSTESGDTYYHDVLLPSTVEAGDTLLVVFVCDDNEQVYWEGDWTVIYDEDAGSSGPTMSIAWKEADGNEDGTTITVTTGDDEQSAHLSYAIENAADPNVSPPEASPEASGSSNHPNPASLSPSGGSKDYLWFAFYGCDDDDMASAYPSTYTENRETYESSGGSGTCAIGAASRDYTSSSDNPSCFTISSEQWEAATVAIYPAVLPDNYGLDLEYQWTSADFDETNEQVCIYVQTANQDGEHLVAYEWTGAAWQSLGTLSSDGWNNFTASYLTGPTYTINIRDQNQPNDETQSTWNIDCIITDCSSTDINYELDAEVQFTDINVARGYEEICIFMGSATAEALDLYIWNGDSWDQLATALVPNQWNNITQSITEDTVTLRFLGSMETSDTFQDTWEIDCTLLYAPTEP